MRTLEQTPRGATHWSLRSMATASGLTRSDQFGLQPHRTECFNPGSGLFDCGQWLRRDALLRVSDCDPVGYYRHAAALARLALNLVDLTNKQLRRGAHRSVQL